MAERDSEKRGPRPILLFGAGRRTREIASVLGALSALDTEGARSLTPLPELGVHDLEELLAPRPGAPSLVEGILILEASRVPSEDIGFVRRFLERRAGWRLLVIGEDAQDLRVRSLLALARARWLAWPPDLEELRALLGAAGVAAASTPASAPAPSPAPAVREERRAPPRTPNGGATGVDVGDLLEELLAGSALAGDGGPRYQFRSTERFLVQRERGPLLEGLGGLVELARRCAGQGGLVRAAVDPGAAGGLRIGLDFPRAGLPEKELQHLLAGAGSADVGPELAEGVAVARQAAALLTEAGDQVELVSEEPGRVRCEVRLAQQAPEKKRSRAGKPEDPFA